jgi:hypothetical protein
MDLKISKPSFIPFLIFSFLIISGCQALTGSRCKIPDGNYFVNDISPVDSATDAEKEFVDNLRTSYQQRNLKILLFEIEKCSLTSVRLQYPTPEAPAILFPVSIFSDQDESIARSIDGSSFELSQEISGETILFAGQLVSSDLLKGKLQLSMDSLDIPSFQEGEVSVILEYYAPPNPSIISQPTDWAKADTHVSPRSLGGLDPQDLTPIPFSKDIHFQWEVSLPEDDE